MKHHRNEFFLATKTEKRPYQGAKEELHRSLERLRVTSVDLWQMHFLVDEEGWHTGMGPDGALEAFIEARKQGLARFLGVTGQGLQVTDFHLRSLERFAFDSVLLPYNPLLVKNESYAAGFNDLLAYCEQHTIAVQTIKSIASRMWGDHEEKKTCDLV
jgi:diketogulonate reductase-like aldo/keto reductase